MVDGLSGLMFPFDKLRVHLTYGFCRWQNTLLLNNGIQILSTTNEKSPLKLSGLFFIYVEVEGFEPAHQVIISLFERASIPRVMRVRNKC